MRLFVYGTLLLDSGTAPARWLRRRVRSTERASVSGRLVAIVTRAGCYPALVGGRPRDRVEGMVCRLALRPGDLARLDRYEGREYRRVATHALIAGTRRRVPVQVYRWRASLPRGARPVPGGEFLAWLASGGARVYAAPAGDALFTAG